MSNLLFARLAIAAVFARQDWRRLLIQLINLDGHVTHDIVRNPVAAFQLDERLCRSVNVQKGVMPLANLIDWVGEIAQAPIFGFTDFCILFFEKCRNLFNEGIDLRGGNVRPRYNNVLVKSHKL